MARETKESSLVNLVLDEGRIMFPLSNDEVIQGLAEMLSSMQPGDKMIIERKNRSALNFHTMFTMTIPDIDRVDYNRAIARIQERHDQIMWRLRTYFAMAKWPRVIDRRGYVKIW